MSLPRFDAAQRSRREGLFFTKERETVGWRRKRKNAATTWRYANPIVVNCQRYGLCPVSEDEPPLLFFFFFLFFCPFLRLPPLSCFSPLVAFSGGAAWARRGRDEPFRTTRRKTSARQTRIVDRNVVLSNSSLAPTART